jgi:uncharacterized protein HemX
MSSLRLPLVILSATLLTAAPALAHPGHLDEQSGHTHWIALAALLAAIGVGAIGYLRGQAARRRRDASADAP